MSNKWILPTLVALTVSSSALAAPHAYLYKDSRVMAMGGAGVATGGYSTSLFQNPAGLSNLSTEHGLIVELLGLSFTASGEAANVTQDILDAIDTDDTEAVKDVLNAYAGTPVHLDFSNYSSVSYNHGDIAWSLGLLAASEANLLVNPYSVADSVEIQARGYGGLNAGVSYTLRELWIGDLALGLGGKFYAQNSYEDTLNAQELIDFEQSGDDIADRASETRTAFSFDIGAIYQIDAPLSPSLGFSVMNIGGLDFEDAFGSQPMTVNIGGAIEPEIPFIKRTRLAIDYMDLLGANTYRLYFPTTNEDGSPYYKDIESDDMMQNLRLGLSALIYDNSWSSLELATGLYQGNVTGGIDFVASIFKLSFSTYAEEVGPVSGDYTDRRYTVDLGIAW